MSAPLYEALERRRKLLLYKQAGLETKAGTTALGKLIDLFSAAKRGAKAQPRLIMKGEQATPVLDKVYESMRVGGDKVKSAWAGANKRPMPTGTNLRPAQRGAYQKGRATREFVGDNKGKLALLAVLGGAKAMDADDKLGNKMGDVVLNAGSNRVELTEDDKAVFAAKKRIRQRQEAEAAEKAAAEAEKRKKAAAKAAGKPGEEWIPGVHNTLTAGAGGAMVGGAGGYALGRSLGWDPVTSGIVGSLGTATAAAMLAHHMKAAKPTAKA